jgi:hypothetical protein
MDLDDLNVRVTDAILRAERVPAGSTEAEEAFREVGRLEESIANITPPEDLEGEIARLGAVTAALSAADPLHALLLVERYLAEGVSREAASKLDALQSRAESMLAETALKAPLVEPVRYTVQRAA